MLVYETWCVTLRKDSRLNMGIVLFSVSRLLHLKVVGKGMKLHAE